MGHPRLLEASADTGYLADEDTHEMPLNCAASGGSADVVRMLLKAGANINRGDDYFTPLGSAVRARHVEAACTLLDARADSDAVCDCFISGAYRRQSVTPLFLAARSGQMEIVRALLAAGADRHKESGHGQLPLPVEAAVLEGHWQIARLLSGSEAVDAHAGPMSCDAAMVDAPEGQTVMFDRVRHPTAQGPNQPLKSPKSRPLKILKPAPLILHPKP